MAFVVKLMGSSLDTNKYTVLCFLLLWSFLSFRFALPGKWPVCCSGSKITSLCGIAHFVTCLFVWINSLWFSFCSTTIFNFIVVIIVVVGSRVFGATVFVTSVSLCVFSLFFQFVSARDTNFCNVRVFYSGGTLACVHQHSCLRHVDSQCLFVALQELPNHLVLILSLGDNLLIKVILQMGLIY